MRLLSRLKSWFLCSDIHKSMPINPSQIVPTEQYEGEKKVEEIEQKLAEKCVKTRKPRIKKYVKVPADIDKLHRRVHANFYMKKSYGHSRDYERKGNRIGKIGVGVVSFIRDMCEYKPESVTSLKTLYIAYLSWNELHNFPEAAKKGLSKFFNPYLVQQIEYKFGTKGHYKRESAFKGIGLKNGDA